MCCCTCRDALLPVLAVSAQSSMAHTTLQRIGKGLIAGFTTDRWTFTPGV